MDMKSTDLTSASNKIEEEQTALERFESELKSTIFGVLFVLLNEHEHSIIHTVIMSLIEFFHILIFPFHHSVCP